MPYLFEWIERFRGFESNAREISGELITSSVLESILNTLPSTLMAHGGS